MPASLMYDFNNSQLISNQNNGLEDRRAFELALEMSLLGLGTETNESGPFGHSMFNTSNNIIGGGGGNNGHTLNNTTPSNNMDIESRLQTKRSQNTTECVPVPSSEHVAEIVGRQGCKIKALRAKTNTYIKTPVRGEEPVFVVTGRREDVCAAKREIMSAADHFSQIRAQRKNNGGSIGPAPNAHLPGNVTIQVRVPYRVVGLVVGPKGATIKRIQQQTNTYIITPSREKDPVFEVTGLPNDVETAKKEIEAHIAIRTGGIINANGSGSTGTPEESSSDFSNSPLLSSLDNTHFSLSMSKAFSLYNQSSNVFWPFTNETGSGRNSLKENLSNPFTSQLSSSKVEEFYSMFSSNESSSSPPEKNLSNRSYDTDEGIGDSPTFDILSTGANSAVSGWPEFVGSNFGSISAESSVSNDISLKFNRRSSSLESNMNSANSISSSPPSTSML